MGVLSKQPWDRIEKNDQKPTPKARGRWRWDKTLRERVLGASRRNLLLYVQCAGLWVILSLDQMINLEDSYRAGFKNTS